MQEIKQEGIETLEDGLPDGYVGSLRAPGLSPVRRVRQERLEGGRYLEMTIIISIISSPERDGG